VQKHEKVLEIGAGSGYMAALLAHRAQRVISLEINPNWPSWPAPTCKRPASTTPKCAQADGAKDVRSMARLT
jgi:protein-L-isoaspartate(D-aspartate) O-methyltransferase